MGEQGDKDRRDGVSDLLRGSFEIIVAQDGSTRPEGLTPICVHAGTSYFPAREWRDLAPIILRWWIESFAQVADGGSATNSFMNGPFSFRITRVGADIELEFIEATLAKDTVVGRAVVPAERYGAALQSAAAQLIGRPGTPAGPETSRLAEALSRFEKQSGG